MHKRKQTKKTIISPKKLRKVSRRSAHGTFSHINNDSVDESSIYLGYEILRGAMNPCNSCRESKAKKEHIPKISERKPSLMPNQLMFLDLATVKKPRKMHNCEEYK